MDEFLYRIKLEQINNTTDKNNLLTIIVNLKDAKNKEGYSLIHVDYTPVLNITDSLKHSTAALLTYDLIRIAYHKCVELFGIESVRNLIDQPFIEIDINKTKQNIEAYYGQI